MERVALHPPRSTLRATMPAHWQLPPGVNRGLWDYLHDPAIARGYDDYLAGSPLADVDRRFCERHFPRPGRLLDLGCGSGRLLLPFAGRGYWPLGVDLSEEMLRVGGDKAAAAGVTVHRLKANLVELGCLDDATFDYAACLFSTLGMIAGATERRRFLGHVFRVLRAGGVFVVHVHNRWFNLWNRAGRRWLLRDTLHAWFGARDAGDYVMPTHLAIAGLTLHLYGRREVVRLLRQSGFQVRQVMPLSLRPDGRLPAPWLFGRLRAFGYLVAANKPEH